MSRNRKPIIPTGEVIFTPGTPFINGKAPRARSLSAAFLHEGQEHFESKGKAIWQKMFEDYPVEYFWGLITLAKVLKIETGQPGDFDKPPHPRGGARSAGAHSWPAGAADAGAVS